MSATASPAILAEIIDDLDRKIDALDDANNRSEQIIRYLILCQRESSMEWTDNGTTHCTSSVSNSMNSAKESHESDCGVNLKLDESCKSNSLEDVLLMAREMREKGATKKAPLQLVSTTGEKLRKTTDRAIGNVAGKPSITPIKRQSTEPKVNGTHKISSQSKSQSATIRIKSDSITSQPIVETGSYPSPKVTEDSDSQEIISVRQHLFAQLEILKRKKRTALHGVNKELYCTQSKFLTKINSRRSFPRSVAYSALKLQREKNSAKVVEELQCDSRGENYAEEDISIQREIEYDQLETVLTQNKDHYDKMIKGKLSRMTLSSMGNEDVKEIFKIWYTTQKYIEMCRKYDEHKSNDLHQRSNNIADLGSYKKGLYFEKVKEDEDKLSELRTNMIDTLLSDGDTQPVGVSDDVLVSRDWLKNRIKICHDFHDEYDIRTRYLIEKSLGRNELKNSVKLLKECCNMKRDGYSPDSHFCERKWISALKYYKSLYSCLTLNERNTSSCMFIPSTHEK